MTAASSLKTPVCDMLGIEYPIFGFNHSVDVTVEVSRAGGIGIYGATRSTPEEIRETLKKIRERVGDRPFGVDLVLPSGMPERNNREDIEAAIPDGHRAFVQHIREKYNVKDDRLPGARSRFVRSNEVARRQIEAVLESDVNLFACGIGSPVEAIAAAQERGKKVVSLVGAPKHARRVKDAGVDIIVAQGYDAGAHTGEIGTFSLVPQIVDIAGDVPILAAGGVATGRHIAAALAMGAQGVWIGTAWLYSKENHTDPVLLKQLIEAGPEDTVISRADSGKTLRQIRTAWSEEWSQDDAPKPLRMPYQDILVGDILGAIQRQKVEPLMHTPAGQGVGNFKEETTVADLMQKFLREAREALGRVRSL
jgi:NAD(P)H-dependent flavin oxidoreductase YrpB (nitropropane dioxygenase family)